MGAKKLYNVTVKCEISQDQIISAVNLVSERLQRTRLFCDLEDIDDLLFDGEVRLIVNFKVNTHKQVETPIVELLNNEWVLMELETAIFRAFLDPVVRDYNNNNTESLQRERQIKEQQQPYTMV